MAKAYEKDIEDVEMWNIYILMKTFNWTHYDVLNIPEITCNALIKQIREENKPTIPQSFGKKTSFLGR